jgi:hypothetical protein
MIPGGGDASRLLVTDLDGDGDTDLVSMLQYYT